MNKILLLFSLVLLLAGAGGALDMPRVKAYPVPFNPTQDSALKILVPADIGGDVTITFSVYDINGDLVTTRSFAAASYAIDSEVIWNGRNSRGSIVKPGLYIIKVIMQNETTGDYGKKIIRILVKG